ncbi:MAG TPA: ribose 5-phosphate isomerase B [Candidatus Omnitrophica bacterium]|nr:ribose 5-phosphate isomerase B [Candidatus Omnitrophota bacterium]
MLSSDKKAGKKSSQKNLKIGLACDHGGFRLKERVKKILELKDYTTLDFGTNSTQSCDYPKLGVKLIRAMLNKKIKRGILICRSGIGYSILANRFKGIRAALCCNLRAVKLSRRHNDSNVLILAGDFIHIKDTKKFLDAWLNTDFESGRHNRRLRQIEKFSK